MNKYADSYRPSYTELLKLNPLLQKKSVTEVEELVSTMISLDYYWDRQELIFFNPEINNTINTQGLDIFTPERLRALHEDIVEEIRINPELYHKKAGRAELYFRKASSLHL